MEIKLNIKQQETFNFFIDGFGSRTNGHENDIKKIILNASNLIDTMITNADLRNINKDKLQNCNNNMNLVYEIFKKITADEQDPTSKPYIIYFMLIMYSHWCESLCSLFKDTISQYYNHKKCIYLSDFEKYFSKKYTLQYNELFERRLIRPLRNAIAHNSLKIDSQNKTIEFYNPKKQKFDKLKFTDIVCLHDTFTMIYFCIKGLLEIIN
jgi:hypothetical protein